jgi:hypothetical protein
MYAFGTAQAILYGFIVYDLERKKIYERVTL